MANYDIDKLHSRILKILLAVDETCRKHHLTYYLWAGSMIGAVRHKGFIPWDDDIDIAMPRPDYEKLIKHCKDWLPEPMEFICAENNDFFPGTFGKICDASTTLIERKHYHLVTGIYIDVFPLDGVPSNPLLRWINYQKYNLYERLIYFTFRDPYKHGHGPSCWIPLLCRKLFNVPRLCQKLRRVMTKYDYEKSSLVADYDDVYHGALPKTVIGTPTPYTFEGNQVLGVENYDKYLSNKYGGYMTIPDKPHQRQHNFFYLSYDQSYRDYQG